MYALKTSTKYLSLHLTQLGASQALRVYNMSDKTGVVAFVSEIRKDLWYELATILVFACIGAMLAVNL